MKRATQAIAASYLVLSLLSFRGVLTSGGSIGLLHDWATPIYPQQLTLLVNNALFSWNQNSLGIYSFNSDAIFKLLLGMSSFISTPFLFKLSLVFILFISGISAYWLSKKLLGCSEAASALAGLFYMLTPVLFTRVIVGYHYYLIGYALLPLVLYSFAVGVRRRSLWHLMLCGLLFGISAFQLQFAIIIPLMLFIYVLSDKANISRSVLPSLLVVFIFSLIQMPVLYYFMGDVLRGGQALGGVSGTAKYIWIYFFAPSLPQAMMLFGKDYEFLFLLYFQNKYLFLPFLLAAISIPVACFASFRLEKARYYIVLAVVSLFLVKGPNPPFGFVYQWLYENIPLSSLFRTSYHWSVLIALSYSMLLGLSYDSLLAALKDQEKLSRWLRDAILVSSIFLVIYATFALSNYSSLAYSLNKRGIPAFSIYLLILAAIFVVALFYIKAKDLARLAATFKFRDRSKAFVSLLFLAAVLIYSWPMFTGDYSGRLQTYEYDEKYHDLYRQIQEEPGDFRILWIPMVQPMVYNGSQYGGYDVLIGYPPKPTFDQGLAHFSDESRYTAFLANLINSQSTEFFGDILDYSSTKYVIYRSDFESVLPRYLPFGSVNEFNWSKEAPLNFLKHQKDLRLKDDRGGIYTFENDFLPHVSAEPPILVAGSLSTIISLSYCKDLLGIGRLPALLYLEDTNSRRYRNLSDTIVLDGDSYLDAVTSFLDRKYKLDAGGYARDLDARSGWTNTFSWWWYDPFAASQMEYGALSLGGNSTLDIQTGLHAGEYRLMVKARSGPEGDKLYFTSSGKTALLDTFSRAESYGWHDLGLFNVTDGKVAINGTGKNVVQRLLVVPERDLDAAYDAAARHLQNQSLLLIYEMERFDTEHTGKGFGSSQGYLDLHPELPVSLDIYIPKEGAYELSLRASNNESAAIIVSLDGKTSRLSLTPSGFRWLHLGSFNLSKGYHELDFKGNNHIKLDLMLLRSGDMVLHDSTSKINIVQSTSFGRADPTSYTLQAQTTEPSLLTFAEAYHPDWVLRDSAGLPLEHYKVNGYANGYWINGSANASLALEFSKQKGYGIALLLSLASGALIAVYLMRRVILDLI